jgi:hypothetical protein
MTELIIDNSISETYINQEIQKYQKKYGKEYKNAKLFFLSEFDNFLSIQSDENSASELIKKIRIVIFDYLAIFLTYDVCDLTNKMIKKYNNTENVIHILDYLESIFNEELYKIMIINVIYEKIKNNVILTQEDKLFFVGIVNIESFKIMIINNILINDNIEEESKILLNENNMTIEDESQKKIEKFIKECYIKCFEDRIKVSKTIIMKYYNEVKNNFSSWNDVIHKCKNIIINNNILQTIKKT